ncbi:MAG: MauE/DoxX family redox-associated membrane protein [Chitinophagaceae bacterium]
MKKISLYAMVVLYIAAGINHFWHPDFYLPIMPKWLPYHEVLVMLSGICEILFAFLLVFPSTRRFAAWCIILLLIAVFPANIQMMFNYMNESNPKLWIAIIRLPLQIVLIWWAYGFTKKLKYLN